MAPLLGLIVFLGVYPKPMLDRIEPVGGEAGRATSRTTATYREPEVARSGVAEHDSGADERRCPRGRGGPRLMAPILALLSQPLDETPEALTKRAGGLVGPRPGAGADRRRAAAPGGRRRRAPHASRRPCTPRSPCVTALGVHRLRHPALEPGARRRPRPVLHAPPGHRHRRLLGVRHDRDRAAVVLAALLLRRLPAPRGAWTGPSPTSCCSCPRRAA